MKTTSDMPIDRGESIGAMEPLSLGQTSRHIGPLRELAVDLIARSEGFRRSLPGPIAASLADLVRSMNCYYSNLIEGHDTHPIDIERALAEDFSAEPDKRNLQLEARAHVAVQAWLDRGGLTHGAACTAAGIAEIHRRFHERMPEALAVVVNPETGEQVTVTGGAWRDRDVRVGRHVAPSPGAVPRFLARFEAHFGPLGRLERLVAAAGAHHRLSWIHPFLDGNGRVMRLMSHATMLESAGSGGLWSVARGLARNVARYTSLLAACDLPRRNDLDGRGTLSEEALAEFTRFFLEVSLDQIAFMESLMQLDELRVRVRLWAEEEMRLARLPAGAGAVFDAILLRGALPRGDLPALLGVSERQARRVTGGLIDSGAVKSASTRAPLELAFPARLASRWMPGLFPDQIGRPC